ncbi:UDP-N-acetylglucosamine transferase subunit ALG14 homolog isoform X2 [Bufo bufo]|uniref:UDP-N-acetylglucosamine transferase subunit ALG14 homolog isoform X2 n=1 Tax=Bufo bufo TaxID=8384 RepID=UPI001ABE81E0|nr:UDP-N-acetylglucosamine transferase subunit ALG14 homolog isoform X2 [Bufo bufo]
MEWLLPAGIGCLLTVLVLRVALVLRGSGEHKPGKKGHVSLLVVAGSGGHTTEVLRLLSGLSKSYYPTHYVLAETDKMSEEKIHSFETSKNETSEDPLILCNGPGTCIPVCFSALLLGVLGIKKIIIVYVESLCRVETLSLSGKILYHVADHFIIQWPLLKDKYPNAIYMGRIV